MTKSVFKGWICRAWTETINDGWVGKIYRVDTEQDAVKKGAEMMRKPFKDHELSREYEIYKDYALEEV